MIVYWGMIFLLQRYKKEYCGVCMPDEVFYVNYINNINDIIRRRLKGICIDGWNGQIK